MTPRWGNSFLFRSPKQLLRLRLRPLKGFFEMTPCPLRALDLPSTYLAELQRNCQVRRPKRKGPRTPLKTNDANLDCAFVENALAYTSLDL